MVRTAGSSAREIRSETTIGIESNTPEREAMLEQFLRLHDMAGAERTVLPRDASFRSYIRLRGEGGVTCLLMDAPPELESIQPFIEVAALLTGLGLKAPAILGQDLASGFLLLEDFGTVKFNQLLQQSAPGLPTAGPTAPDRWTLYRVAIDALLTLHAAPIDNLSLPRYDQGEILREVGLFTEWYLPASTGETLAASQEKRYIQIWEELLPILHQYGEPVIVHRDYHVDNLMWLDQGASVESLGVLDFQDAVLGSPAYDLVSLLKDARIHVPPELQQKGFDYYLQQAALLPRFGGAVDRKWFLAQYALWNVQRNLKIMGIFARKAQRDHMPGYLQYLPRVIGHIHEGIKHPLLLPLREWLESHAPLNFSFSS